MYPTYGKVVPAIASDYPKIVIPIIENARSSIDILVYQWKWYGHQGHSAIQKFNLAICNAARRGVKVRVLMNIEHYSHPITKINTRTEKFLKQAGCKVKLAHIGGRTHAKMIIVDKEVVIVGSHNFCKSSFSANAEAAVVLAGFPQIQQFIRYFENLWSGE